MTMERLVVLFSLVLVCTVPQAARADCGSDCVSRCADVGSGTEEYDACMQPCLDACLADDPPPVPEPSPPAPVEE
jgi:hypothetical protein